MNSSWNVKILLLCHLIGALLFASLFWPITEAFWNTIDIAFFKCINSTLRDHPYWQLFWAFANHKLADWVEDLCVLCFFIAYVRQAHQNLAQTQSSGARFYSLLYCRDLVFHQPRAF